MGFLKKQIYINSITTAKKWQTIVIEINLIKKLNIPINTEKSVCNHYLQFVNDTSV